MEKIISKTIQAYDNIIRKGSISSCLISKTTKTIYKQKIAGNFCLFFSW